MSERMDLAAARIPPEELAELGREDSDLLQEMLDGISPAAQKGVRRENCSQGLMRLAEEAPDVLLPHWDYLTSLLRSDNGFSRYAAVYVLASLARVAEAGRFEEAFDDYFGLLGGESVMVASHTALNAARVANFKPELRERIIQRLLADGPTHLRPDRQELLKAYVIEALATLMSSAEHPEAILDYVQEAAGSASPKTRKLAKAFVQKWSEPD